MFTKMINELRKNPRKIVFTEGEDERILIATTRLRAERLIEPIILGDETKIRQYAATKNLDLEGIIIIDPLNYDKKAMISLMVELRKGKMSEEDVIKALNHGNYFGTMLVKMGLAHGLLGGATYSTADTVRPALQLIKTKPGSKIVSSSFILRKPGRLSDEIYVMSDCAINLNPTSEELVEIAIESAKTAEIFGVKPSVALLSYSTLGSAKGETVDTVKNAVKILKEQTVSFEFDGELQFDAAFSADVASKKAPDSPVAGHANVFIFPNINAGNIGYKIAQRLGGFEALGPILQGLNAPINDLSRGCNAEEVYKMAIITATFS